MTEEFNTWWDNDLLTQTNPYLDGTPVYWAWEGWQAGIRAESALERMAENARELGLDYEQPAQLPTLSEFLQSSAENKAEVMERVIDKAIAMQQVKEKNT